MITRFLIVTTLTASVAIAGDLDRKSPAPLPQKAKPCLRVYTKPRCIPVELEVLRLWGLEDRQYVTPLTMIEIDEENRKFLRTKLR